MWKELCGVARNKRWQCISNCVFHALFRCGGCGLRALVKLVDRCHNKKCGKMFSSDGETEGNISSVPSAPNGVGVE